MLTQIDVDSENAFLIKILGATPKDSLLVRQITGLGPPDITLYMGDYARDGGNYQGRKVEKRNVVITFDINPNYANGETVSGLRKMLYKTFADPLVEADYLKLNLHDDEDGVLYLVGYMEKFETEVFSVETMAQISLLCPDPFIRAANKTIMTDPVGWSTVPFTYGGTAETGFEASITVTSATPALTIENNGKKMILTRAFAVGDVVKVNTNRGSRSLTVTPSGGAEVSILSKLEPTSPWLELHSQSNTLKVYGAAPANLVAAVRSFSYTSTYWGV